MTRPNEQFTGERLYAVQCELLVALPKDADPSGVLDTLNMMLIPLQRCELESNDQNSVLIDYTLDDPVRMTIPADGYDYDTGFCITTPSEPPVPSMSFLYSRQAPRSADELDAEYNKDGDGQHPVHTRAEWRNDVAQENTSLGYWQWLADLLEMIEANE